jgi:hypothetical protein
VRLMHSLTGFRWRVLLVTYAKSAVLGIATAAPLLIAYRFWLPPAELGFLRAIPLLVGGLGLWLSLLFAIRHPAREEISGMFIHVFNLPAIVRLRGATKPG